jgi:hypothetical protein
MLGGSGLSAPPGVRCVVELCVPRLLGGRVLVRAGVSDVGAEVEAMISLRGIAVAQEGELEAGAPGSVDGGVAMSAAERAARLALGGQLGSSAATGQQTVREDSGKQADALAGTDAAVVRRTKVAALFAHRWLALGSAADASRAANLVARALPGHGPLWAHWAGELRAGRGYVQTFYRP